MTSENSRTAVSRRAFIKGVIAGGAAVASANYLFRASTVLDEGFEPADKYQAFLDVLDRDARDSRAAIELVLVQPAISSQLVDNLNASIHLPGAPNRSISGR